MKNWKDDFDKEFQTTKDLQLDMNVYHVKTHRIQSHRQDIKDFIESLLEKQKKELIGKQSIRLITHFHDDGDKDLLENILEIINDHD